MTQRKERQVLIVTTDHHFAQCHSVFKSTTGLLHAQSCHLCDFVSLCETITHEQNGITQRHKGTEKSAAGPDNDG